MKPVIAANYLGWPVLAAALALSPSHAMAQAAPGPLGPPPSDSQVQRQAPPPQPAAKPKPPDVPPRTTLAGSWALNTEDSDNAMAKVRAAEASTVNTNAGRMPPDPYPDGYPYPGGYPGGYPYPGGGPMGYPDPGMGTPRMGSGGEDIAGNPKMQPLIHPPDMVRVELQNPEVDMTDDHFKKLTFYTDGRQLPKQTDQSHTEVLAHWNGNQLVSDEKSPLGGKMSRTFELSSDGRKVYETLRIDHGKKSPIVIRYVYNATNADVQNGPEADPDRPMLKRHSDDNDNPPQ